MGRQNIPSSHHIAAAMLAFGLAGGGSAAMAQDGTPSDNIIDGDTVISAGEDAPINVNTDDPVITGPQTSEVATTFHIDPLMPVPLIAGLAALYAAMGVYPFRRRIKGAALRAFAGVTLTAVMINPEINQENREILPTEILVVLDQSGSQKFGQRSEEMEAAYRDVVRQLTGLENVNIRTIGHDSRAADGALQEGTQLFSTIREGMADIPRDQLGGIVLLTDGLIHDVPEEMNIAGAAVPIHAFITGQEDEFDRRIEIVSAPSFGLPGEAQTIALMVTDQGDVPPAPANVSVTVNGEVVQEYTAVPGEVLNVSLPVDLTGTNVYSFETDIVDGELTDVNNIISTEIEGVREDLNVLLLSGSLAQSNRAMRGVLKTDPSVNLVHFTYLRGPQQGQNVPLNEINLIPVPSYEIFNEMIDDFDLIILDRAVRYQITGVYLNSIRAYIERGGSLLTINGSEFVDNNSSLGTSHYLEDTLPVLPYGGEYREEGYRPEIEGDGTRHPVTRGLGNVDAEGNPTWGQWLTSVTGQTVDDANVLLYGPDDSPLLVLNRVGEGRVATLMSDNFWLWDRGYDGGGPSAALLQRISHWLMAYPEFEEENLKLTMSEDGETLIVTRQTLSEEVNAPAVIISPSGAEIEVPLEQVDNGLYQGQISVEELGFYRARQQRDLDDSSAGPESIDGGVSPAGANDDLQSFMSVGPANPLEFEETISTLSRLAPFIDGRAGTISRIAGEQDGDDAPVITVPQFAVVEGAGENIDAFNDAAAPAIARTNRYIVSDVSDRPLIPGWVGMLTMLGLFGGAWYREGGGQNLFRRLKDQPTPQ